MDDENIRFLVSRMDSGFRDLRNHTDEKFNSLSQKIDDLQAYKNRLVGMAVLAGGIGSFAMNFVMKYL